MLKRIEFEGWNADVERQITDGIELLRNRRDGWIDEDATNGPWQTGSGSATDALQALKCFVSRSEEELPKLMAVSRGFFVGKAYSCLIELNEITCAPTLLYQGVGELEGDMWVVAAIIRRRKIRFEYYIPEAEAWQTWFDEAAWLRQHLDNMESGAT